MSSENAGKIRKITQAREKNPPGCMELSCPLTGRLPALPAWFPHRKVFFTDYGQIPKVERCDMDGQNRTKLVDSKIVFPHGITLDLVSRLVYWADAYLDYIEVVDYEGKNRHTIIQGLLVRGAEGRTSLPGALIIPLIPPPPAGLCKVLRLCWTFAFSLKQLINSVSSRGR